jgi:hypothetical protein
VAQERPAPVVTVIDPNHRVPLALQPVAPPAPSRVRGSDRVLAVAVIGVLVLGLVGLHSLRQKRAADRPFRAMRAVPTSHRTIVSNPSYVLLQVAVTGVPAQDVRAGRVTADQGWQVPPQQEGDLYDGTVVTLLHPVLCTAKDRLPTTLTVSATVGGRARTLVVPVEDDEEGADALLTGLCTVLAPEDAVALVTSTVTAEGDHSRLTARLRNLSRQASTVAGVGFRGFSFRPSHPLPLLLPARRSAALVDDPTEVQELVLDAAVADCGIARAALDAAHASTDFDQVTLTVRSNGREGFSTVVVRGIDDYLETQWQGACRG